MRSSSALKKDSRISLPSNASTGNVRVKVPFDTTTSISNGVGQQPRRKASGVSFATPHSHTSNEANSQHRQENGGNSGTRPNATHHIGVPSPHSENTSILTRWGYGNLSDTNTAHPLSQQQQHGAHHHAHQKHLDPHASGTISTHNAHRGNGGFADSQTGAAVIAPPSPWAIYYPMSAVNTAGGKSSLAQQQHQIVAVNIKRHHDAPPMVYTTLAGHDRHQPQALASASIAENAASVFKSSHAQQSLSHHRSSMNSDDNNAGGSYYSPFMAEEIFLPQQRQQSHFNREAAVGLVEIVSDREDPVVLSQQNEKQHEEDNRGAQNNGRNSNFGGRSGGVTVDYYRESNHAAVGRNVFEEVSRQRRSSAFGGGDSGSVIQVNDSFQHVRNFSGVSSLSNSHAVSGSPSTHPLHTPTQHDLNAHQLSSANSAYRAGGAVGNNNANDFTSVSVSPASNLSPASSPRRSSRPSSQLSQYASPVGGGGGGTASFHPQQTGSSVGRQIPFDVSVSSMASEDMIAMDAENKAMQTPHSSHQNLKMLAANQSLLLQHHQQQQQPSSSRRGSKPSVDLRAQHAAAIKQRKNAAKQQRGGIQNGTPSGSVSRDPSPQQQQHQTASATDRMRALSVSSSSAGVHSSRSVSVPFSSLSSASQSPGFNGEPQFAGGGVPSQHQPMSGTPPPPLSLDEVSKQSHTVHNILDRALESDLLSVFKGAIIQPQTTVREAAGGVGGVGGDHATNAMSATLESQSQQNTHGMMTQQQIHNIVSGKNGGKFPTKLTQMPPPLPGAGLENPSLSRFSIENASTVASESTPATTRPFPSIASAAVTHVLVTGGGGATNITSAKDSASRSKKQRGKEGNNHRNRGFSSSSSLSSSGASHMHHSSSEGVDSSEESSSDGSDGGGMIGGKRELFIGDSPVAATSAGRSRVKPKKKASSHSPRDDEGNTQRREGTKRRHAKERDDHAAAATYNPLLALTTASSVGVRKKNSSGGNGQSGQKLSVAQGGGFLDGAKMTPASLSGGSSRRGVLSSLSPERRGGSRLGGAAKGGEGGGTKRSTSRSSNGVAALARNGHDAYPIVADGQATNIDFAKLPKANIDLGGGRMVPIHVASGAIALKIADAFIAHHRLDPDALRAPLIEFLNYTAASLEAAKQLKSIAADASSATTSILNQKRTPSSAGGESGRGRSASNNGGSVPRVAMLEAPRIRRARESAQATLEAEVKEARRKKGEHVTSSSESSDSDGGRQGNKQRESGDGNTRRSSMSKPAVPSRASSNKNSDNSASHKPHINAHSKALVEEMRRRSAQAHEDMLRQMHGLATTDEEEAMHAVLNGRYGALGGSSIFGKGTLDEVMGAKSAGTGRGKSLTTGRQRDESVPKREPSTTSTINRRSVGGSTVFGAGQRANSSRPSPSPAPRHRTTCTPAATTKLAPFHPDSDLATPMPLRRHTQKDTDAASPKDFEVDTHSGEDCVSSSSPLDRSSSTTALIEEDRRKKSLLAAGHLTGVLPTAAVALANSGKAVHVIKAALPVHLRLHPTARLEKGTTVAVRRQSAHYRQDKDKANGPASPGRRLHQNAMDAKQRREDACKSHKAATAAAEAASLKGVPSITRVGQRASSRVAVGNRASSSVRAGQSVGRQESATETQRDHSSDGGSRTASPRSAKGSNSNSMHVAENDVAAPRANANAGARSDGGGDVPQVQPLSPRTPQAAKLVTDAANSIAMSLDDDDDEHHRRDGPTEMKNAQPPALSPRTRARERGASAASAQPSTRSRSDTQARRDKNNSHVNSPPSSNRSQNSFETRFQNTREQTRERLDMLRAYREQRHLPKTK